MPEQSRFDEPTRLLGETQHGFFVGRYFIPKAWMTDKCRKERLAQFQMWNMYYSRILMAFIPIILLLIAWILSATESSCRWGDNASVIVTGSRLVPQPLQEAWGPFVAFAFGLLVMFFDAFYFHPLQMNMRTPVMRLWDGQFSKFSRTSTQNKWDILAVHRTRVPQPHQTSMYHTPQEGDPRNEADSAFWTVRAKIIEKCAAEDLALYETPEGCFFVRMPNATALHEININEEGEPVIGQAHKRRSRRPGRGWRTSRRSDRGASKLWAVAERSVRPSSTGCTWETMSQGGAASDAPGPSAAPPHAPHTAASCTGADAVLSTASVPHRPGRGIGERPRSRSVVRSSADGGDACLGGDPLLEDRLAQSVWALQSSGCASHVDEHQRPHGVHASPPHGCPRRCTAVSADSSSEPGTPCHSTQPGGSRAFVHSAASDACVGRPVVEPEASGGDAATVAALSLGCPLSPCAHVDSEDAPLPPQRAQSSTRHDALRRPRCTWRTLGTYTRSSEMGSSGGIAGVAEQRPAGGPRHGGGGGGPVAEAIEPGNGGGVVRPHRFFDGDSTGSAALSDGSSAAAASVRHGEGGVQGSGMTLEELMEDDGRRHAPGRALAAQISLRREERLLKPGDFPPLVAAQGNVQMLDADATSLYPDTAELMTRAAENGRTADAAAAADDANAAARKLKATPSRRYLDLQLSSTLALGADLITQRLALWGVHVDGGGGEDDAIIVDDDKVHEELPDFLAAQLPLWDGSEKQQNSIVIFQHDRTQGHRCEAYLKPQYYSHWYLRVMQFVFLLGITAAAVSFAVSVTWCRSDLWTTIALSTISATMWSIKAPLYIPVWSPSYWPKRIGQVIFNTMFTMDLWSDLTVALGLAFDSETRLGVAAALFFFCVASPVDFANLCIRTSFALEDAPQRTHLMNIIFETPMLAFNLYLVLGPVASAGKIGGWISVVFTFMTLFNATLMYLYKPEVLKYRAVLGHMVQRVGKAVTGRLPNSGSAPNLEADAAAAMDGGRDMPHLESTYLGLSSKMRKAAAEADSPLASRTPKIPAVASLSHTPTRALRPTLSLTRTHIPRAGTLGQPAAPFPEHRAGGPAAPTRAPAPGRGYPQTPAALNAAAAALAHRTFFPRTSSLTYSVEDDGGDAGRRSGTVARDRRDRSSASEFSDVFSMSNPDSFTMDSGFAMYDNTLYRDAI